MKRQQYKKTRITIAKDSFGPAHLGVAGIVVDSTELNILVDQTIIQTHVASIENWWKHILELEVL